MAGESVLGAAGAHLLLLSALCIALREADTDVALGHTVSGELHGAVRSSRLCRRGRVEASMDVSCACGRISVVFRDQAGLESIFCQAARGVGKARVGCIILSVDRQPATTLATHMGGCSSRLDAQRQHTQPPARAKRRP